MIGALEAIQSLLAAGLIGSIESLVRAETAGDLIEQAEELQSAGYSLAAAVIARAVLEEHLRNLCQFHSCLPAAARPTIETYKNELRIKTVLDKIAVKTVDHMAAIGNAAAHNTPDFDPTAVRLLLAELTAFLAKHPLS
jgi:hypothetical protein